MEVNLSRIHNILKQLASETRDCYNQASKPFLAGAGSFTFTIFESTTSADLAAFLDNIKERRQTAMEFLTLARQKTAYAAWLRRELDAANRQSGVADKLLEISCLQQEIANLNHIAEVIALSRSDGLEPVKGADYYKASFTDKQKTYELSVKMFSVDDYETVGQEIREKEKLAAALKDEVALINQTTRVRIMSFDEFMARREK